MIYAALILFFVLSGTAFAELQDAQIFEIIHKNAYEPNKSLDEGVKEEISNKANATLNNLKDVLKQGKITKVTVENQALDESRFNEFKQMIEEASYTQSSITDPKQSYEPYGVTYLLEVSVDKDGSSQTYTLKLFSDSFQMDGYQEKSEGMMKPISIAFQYQSKPYSLFYKSLVRTLKKN